MRELNQKIYEIAGIKDNSGEIEYDDSVSISQIITDNYLDEKIDKTDQSITRKEADKVISEETEGIYGKKGTGSITQTNVDLKEVFGAKSPSKNTKKSPAKNVAAKKVKKTVKTTKSGKKVPAKSVKKAKKKSSNNLAVLLLLLAAAAAAYYFLT